MQKSMRLVEPDLYYVSMYNMSDCLYADLQGEDVMI